MTVANSFRGIQGIRIVKSQISRLAQWNKRFRPDIQHLTVERKDFDLIARWPKAAKVEGFDVTHNGIFFDGLQLNYAAGPGRYETRITPQQDDFVHIGITAESVRVDIANVMQDRADEAVDATRIHASRTLDEFLEGQK